MSMELDVSFVEPGPDDKEDEDRSFLEKSTSFAKSAVHTVDLKAGPSSNSSPSVLQTKKSVLLITAEWLGFTTTSGSLMDFGPHTYACIVAESELRSLAEAASETLSMALKAMAEQNVRLFVLGQSFLSTVSSMTFEGFPLEPTYVHQPFGPRKMIRAMAGRVLPPSSTRFSQSPTYSSHREPTTPVSIEASGESSGVGRDSYLWNAGPTPIRDGRNSSTDKHSQATPTSQHQQRQAQPDSPSVVASASNNSKTSASHLAQPSEHQDEAKSKEQQAVLLVEDNNINMQLLKALMRKLQLPFDTAWNGREALDLWSANPSKYLMILT
ncbi:hypothetical protein KC334_g20738, partial [Hortaea werneckii]